MIQVSQKKKMKREDNDPIYDGVLHVITITLQKCGMPLLYTDMNNKDQYRRLSIPGRWST
jgi:hypothetical protein